MTKTSYNEKELKLLQKHLFSILEKTILLFNENNISFVACGGTALGVERHSNIIPWDDDIDLAVFIDDYKKLKNLKYLFRKHQLEILDFESNPKTPFTFIKVVDTNTVFIDNYNKNIEIPNGIFIDIFPFNYVPRNKIKYLIRQKIYRFLQQCFIVKETTYNDNKIIQLSKFILKIITLLIPKTTLFFLMKRLYDKEGSEIGFLGFKNLKFKKEQYDNSIKMKFGKLKIPQIQDSQNHLANYYGRDFMSLPPPNKRTNHKPIYLKL